MTVLERQNQEKQVAARRGVSYVEDGMIVGLGTGTTAARAIRLLGERVRDGLDIRGVPTSLDTERLAKEQGIRLIDLAEATGIDVTLDGADEVDPHLGLIKGGGGALLREKIVAFASRRLIIMADASKQVRFLGAFPLPIAVVPFAAPLILRRVAALGASVKLRMNGEQQPFVSDDGLYILDCAFGKIANTEALARELEAMPGLVEHGMFLNMAEIAIFASGDQITEQVRQSDGSPTLRTFDIAAAERG